jgi:hypothetical protein
MKDMGGDVFVLRIDDDAWEPDSEVGGLVQFLFEEGDRAAGLWRPAPGMTLSEPIVLPARETIVVLQGSARIEIEGGPTLDLRHGDMATMPKGARTTWHLSPDFLEVWLYS